MPLLLSSVLAWFKDGNSNPKLLLNPKSEEDCRLLSIPDIVFNEPADIPGWNAVVNAFNDGGRLMSLNILDICGSREDISVPSDETPNPLPSPEYIK